MKKDLTAKMIEREGKKMAENREYNTKDELINQIISEEYRMFSEVQNIGGRASCQDDYDTFYIMRCAQHSIFAENTLKSYLQDIEDAQKAERNLITEKYSWMMEETDPAWFEEKLSPHLPRLSPRKMRLVESMTVTFMNCYEDVKKQYPNMLAWGRDPYDNQGGASIRLYFSGELKTWSEGTLLLACQDIISHLEKHENPVRMIYEKIMDFYSRVLM